MLSTSRRIHGVSWRNWISSILSSTALTASADDENKNFNFLLDCWHAMLILCRLISKIESEAIIFSNCPSISTFSPSSLFKKKKNDIHDGSSFGKHPGLPINEIQLGENKKKKDPTRSPSWIFFNRIRRATRKTWIESDETTSVNHERKKEQQIYGRIKLCRTKYDYTIISLLQDLSHRFVRLIWLFFYYSPRPKEPTLLRLGKKLIYMYVTFWFTTFSF